jgi:stage III sporulation protein AH
MKNIKWVILGLALLTGLAVYLNRDRLLKDDSIRDAEEYFGDADFVYDGADEKNEYFVSARYNREKKRDEATAVLNSVISDPDATGENKALAYSEIEHYAFSETCETAIESLIMAKGFGECIAFVSRDTVSIVVSESSLTSAQAAQITDIAVSQTGYSPSNVTVIEYDAGQSSPEVGENGADFE